jgi:2-amino-4-hydroxy-6-hydroxymethyldihydropteridine diphosphokinase
MPPHMTAPKNAISHDVMTDSPAVIAYLGIGSNIGDSMLQVVRALREIDELPGTRLLRCSSLYETDPVGFIDQPRFINAVASVSTHLAPRALLEGLLDIEQRHGRMRMMKNGPRTLDLDILLYGDRRIGDAGLTIPHPHLHERAFVLEPLLEIAPDCEVPGLGRAQQFRALVQGQGVKKIAP